MNPSRRRGGGRDTWAWASGSALLPWRAFSTEATNPLSCSSSCCRPPAAHRWLTGRGGGEGGCLHAPHPPLLCKHPFCDMSQPQTPQPPPSVLAHRGCLRKGGGYWSHSLSRTHSHPTVLGELAFSNPHGSFSSSLRTFWIMELAPSFLSYFRSSRNGKDSRSKNPLRL